MELCLAYPLSPCSETNCSVHKAVSPGHGKLVDLQQMKQSGTHRCPGYGCRGCIKKKKKYSNIYILHQVLHLGQTKKLVSCPFPQYITIGSIIRWERVEIYMISSACISAFVIYWLIQILNKKYLFPSIHPGKGLFASALNNTRSNNVNRYIFLLSIFRSSFLP